MTIMVDADALRVVVHCQGDRDWVAATEHDASVRSAGSWPEQAVRNLTRRLGLPRGHRATVMRIALPADLEAQLAKHHTRRRDLELESHALLHELLDLAGKLLRLGVKQVPTAEYLAVAPQRLGALLTRRARCPQQHALLWQPMDGHALVRALCDIVLMRTHAGNASCGPEDTFAQSAE